MTDLAVQSGVGGGGWPHELDGEYDCLGELGRGGMAVVYRARERALGREVAVKVVRPRFHTDSESVARLAREARTVAQLEHPNIVSLHAVKPLTNGLALVMQLVPGRTLKDALSRGALSPSESELVLRDIARALAYAHRCGVVHRDVKPENIFLDEITGRALLSDFGVARSIEENTELTATGTAIGTPTYMSPEQIDGGHLDGRSDLYSLGMVGWEMLSGQRPWAGESLYSVIYRQKHDPLPPLDFLRNDVPAKLQYLIEGLMHKNPDRRWASAARFLTLLSGDDNVPGLKEWVAAAKKRRRSGAYRPVTPARNPSHSPSANPAMSTVKFRRDDEGATAEAGVPSPDERQAIPIGDADATQRLARSPAWGAPAVHPPDQLSAAPRRRTLWWVGGAMAAAVVTIALVARQRQLEPTRVLPDSAHFADGSQVEVPVVPPTDSATLPAISPAESLARASGALTHRDSLQLRRGGNVDSLRALAAAELAGRSTPSGIPDRRFPAGTPATGASALPPGISASSTATATSTGSVATSGRDTAARDAFVAVSFPADRGVIAAGGRHSCMLDEAGKARCWGNNERGQLGDGSFDAHAEPAAIVGDFTLNSISAGVWHSCGVAREGEVYCWGSNDAGQLGDGTTSPRSAPVRVNGNASFRQVRAGASHSCGLTRGGAVACWGSNAQGQLGDGSRATHTTPVAVPLGMQAGAIAVGRAHTCALTLDGTAWCWGQNDAGQLGDGSSTARATPVQVATDQRFVSIAAGNQHTCAVSTSGTIWCWGRNNFGQLGDGSTTDATTPQSVDASLSFATVTAGQLHSCARARDGRAFCWGRNTYGQLGDGGSADRSRPVPVRGGTAYASVNASGAHTCAVTAGGEGFCWGYNIDGQLGGGDRENASAPARVLPSSR
ncbi:MAG: protein kinase [Gemmatimonadaceae bacterium]|nr:protein kinase [Gemmatimonadaceae bacterium]